MVEGLGVFLSDQVLGEYRRDLLTESLDQMDTDAQHERELRAASLRQAIAEAETTSKRLLRGLEAAWKWSTTPTRTCGQALRRCQGLSDVLTCVKAGRARTKVAKSLAVTFCTHRLPCCSCSPWVLEQ
ncbi:hypothetical protein G5C60_21970 [Streptomyces sp. HC44]|uniref:Uncharacterized protein n=1 Tax=Streptomyces scabichelini TaxID=2711217 RepID=A0A6G4V7W0_9ACTN|nr:hypothetical protein [Streptomyces scabichelini]NGO10182.1 hypothetical protein [Streptomyces scabichelini]